MDYREWIESNTQKVTDLGAILGIGKEYIKKQAIDKGIDPASLIQVGIGILIDRNKESDFIELQNNIKEEKERLFNDYDFMYDAFMYQFYNTEYCISYNADNAIEQLGLTPEKILKSKSMTKAYRTAKKDYQVKHEMY